MKNRKNQKLWYLKNMIKTKLMLIVSLFLNMQQLKNVVSTLVGY